MIEPPDLHATDARVWAKEWCRVARIKLEEYGEGLDEIIEEGWMATWFANAIEAGRDAGAKCASGAQLLRHQHGPSPDPHADS